ncbi:hypothetical protein H4R34_006432, partial [Dimargaris verticillata]
MFVSWSQRSSRLQPPESNAETTQGIYQREFYAVPDNRHSFINDTHAVFSSLQEVYQSQHDHGDGHATSVQVAPGHVRRLSMMYRDAIVRQFKRLQ